MISDNHMNADLSEHTQLDGRGFSIRCPHCFDWSEWPTKSLSEQAIKSEDEWKSILSHLNSQPADFQHPKLLTCQHHPGHGCPVPFQAFIFEDSALAHRARQQVRSWSPRYAFRLPRLDHSKRWGHSAITFVSKPVSRQKHIELECLLDKNLLSRAVLGMAFELNAPLTVFTPRFFDGGQDSDPLWVPLEAYSPQQGPVPPQYNLFCEICREAFHSAIQDTCEAKSLSPTNCPIGVGRTKDGISSCDGRPASCTLNPPNWNACPSFLKMRIAGCACYESDLGSIRGLDQAWKTEVLEPASRQCWAGLFELALPIVIHDHLAAVAMTGQLFLPECLAELNADAIVAKHPVLAPHRRRLKRIIDIVQGHIQPNTPMERYTLQFVADAQRLATLKSSFLRNVQLIQSPANDKYRQNRARAESAFRQELLGQVAEIGITTDRKSRHDTLLRILSRMREFWAFRSVYLFSWADGTKRLTLIAKSEVKCLPEYLESLEMDVVLLDSPIDDIPCHPLVLRFSPPRQPHPNTWVESFLSAYEKYHIKFSGHQLDKDNNHFIVLFKQGAEINILVYAGRDKANVSPLRTVEAGSISLLCQQAILDTSENVLHAYFSKLTLARLNKLQDVLTTAAMSTTLPHNLRGDLATAGDICKYIADSPIEVPLPSTLLDMAKLGKETIKCDLEILTRIIDFRKNGKPDLEKKISLKRLVEKCRDKARLSSWKILLTLPLEDCEAYLDSLLFEVALGNLFENIKKRELDIKCINVRFDKLEGGDLALVIEDDGVGFPGPVLAEFYAFDSANLQQAEGSGIGLLLVRAVAKLHGGCVLIKNRCNGNRGGRVELHIPKKLL